MSLLIDRQAPPGFELAQTALLQMVSRDDPLQAVELAKQARASERVQLYLKAAVSASTLEGNTAFAPLSAGFVEGLKPYSAFDAMTPNMRRVPLHTKLAAVTTAATGEEVAEGAPKPIVEMSFESLTISPRKVSSQALISNELARSSAEAVPFLLRELRSAVATATDTVFLAELTSASGTPTVTGTSDAGADLAAAFALMSPHAASRFYIILSPALAASLAFTGSGGPPLFPDMSPSGGTIGGVAVVVSDGLSGGSPPDVLVVDASRILAADGGVRTSTARHATVEASDSPADPTVAGTVMISLWQRNLLGCRAERTFGFEKIGDSVVVITGPTW